MKTKGSNVLDRKDNIVRSLARALFQTSCQLYARNFKTVWEQLKWEYQAISNCFNDIVADVCNFLDIPFDDASIKHTCNIYCKENTIESFPRLMNIPQQPTKMTVTTQPPPTQQPPPPPLPGGPAVTQTPLLLSGGGLDKEDSINILFPGGINDMMSEPPEQLTVTFPEGPTESDYLQAATIADIAQVNIPPVSQKGMNIEIGK